MQFASLVWGMDIPGLISLLDEADCKLQFLIL